MSVNYLIASASGSASSSERRAYGSERENWETGTAFDFARDCGYISEETHKQHMSLNSEVGKMLRSMHEHPEKFLTPNA